MTPQAAYDLLVSASNYCLVFDRTLAAYNALAGARAEMFRDGHVHYDAEHDHATLAKWQYIRGLQVSAA